MSHTATNSIELSQRFKDGQSLIELDALARFNERAQITANFLTCFETVQADAACFAAVIGQAVTDSMPDMFFRESCMDPLFSSGVPEVYDAYDFLNTSRLDLYANIINIDTNLIRSHWKRLHRQWKKNVGPAVTRNIFMQCAKIMSNRPEKSAEFMDAKSFLYSPQFSFWCRIVDVLPATQRENILGLTEQMLEKNRQSAMQRNTTLRAA